MSASSSILAPFQAPMSPESAWVRLYELRALLTAIDVGELLADAPSQSAARRRHAAAVSLISIMGRELETIIAQLQSEDPDA